MSTTSDEATAGASMPIDELSDAVGHYVWVSRHMAAALGEWQATETDAALATYVHTLARRFADHGERWAGLLADSPALAAGERVQPPSAGWDELFPAGEVATSEHLVSLVHIVLPRLLASLEDFVRRVGPVAEAAERRRAGIVIDDLRSLRNRGGQLLDERASAPQQRRLSAALRHRFTELSC